MGNKSSKGEGEEKDMPEPKKDDNVRVSKRSLVQSQKSSSRRFEPEDPTRPPSSRQLIASAKQQKQQSKSTLSVPVEQEEQGQEREGEELFLSTKSSPAEQEEQEQNQDLSTRSHSESLMKGSYFTSQDDEWFEAAELAEEEPETSDPPASREPSGILGDDLPPPPEVEEEEEEEELQDKEEEEKEEEPKEEVKIPLVKEPSGVNVKEMPKEPPVVPVPVTTKPTPSRNPYNPFQSDPSGAFGKDLPKVIPLPITKEEPKDVIDDPSKVIINDEPKIIPAPFPVPLPIVDDDDDDDDDKGGEDEPTTPETDGPMDSVSFFTPLGPRENVIDLDTMKDNVWFVFDDWWRRISGFLLLIVLASIIATCGIIYDSPATVIGAMIVAPLMTPILGTMLGIILKDFVQFLVSFSFVLLGGAIAVCMGYGFSALTDEESIHPDNNTQVAARISPKLLDLVAAVATGAVAAVAMVRADIAASLPGVSIAISLVPPLNVVGVCFRLRLWSEATGALVLFITNYLCISVVGMFVMNLYQVHRMGRIRKYTIAKIGLWIYQKISMLILLALMAVVVIILYYTTSQYNASIDRTKCLRNFDWDFPENDPFDSNGNAAEAPGEWTVSRVVVDDIVFLTVEEIEWSATVSFTGRPPFPVGFDALVKDAAEQCDIDHLDLQFIPTYRYRDLLSPALEQPVVSWPPTGRPTTTSTTMPTELPTTSTPPSESTGPSLSPTLPPSLTTGSAE